MSNNIPKSGPNRELVDAFPSGWDITKLGEIKTDSRYGLNESAKDSEDKGKPRYIRVTDIGETGLKDEIKTVDCEVGEQDMLNKGDLLFARSGSVGKVYLHKDANSQFTHGGYTIRYRIDTDILKSEFVYYYTQSKMVQDWFSRRSRGSTQVNISTSELDDLVIPVPPLEVQEEVVSLLSDVDAYIEKTSERIDLLEQQKQATLQQIFGNNGEIFKDESGERMAPASWSRFRLPDTWDVLTLEECCDIQTGKGFESQYFNYNREGWPLIKRATVNGTEDESTYTTEEFDDRYIIEEGDVLISMDGNFEVKLWDGAKAALNQRVCKITSTTQSIENRYLGYVLQPIIKHCEWSTAGTTVSSLSNSQLENIQIPVPPIEKQKEIIRLLDSINSAIKETRHSLEKAKYLKQGLLQEIFSN